MSNTLKELYTSFRQEFGSFRDSDNDEPEFLAERQSIIEDGLEQLEAGNFYQAYLEVNDRGGDLRGITSGDPIPALLLLRCADEAVRAGLNAFVKPDWRAFVFELLEANRSAATGYSGLRLQCMLDDMKEALGDAPASEAFKRLNDTTRYFRQYGLFRKIGLLIDNKMKMGDRKQDWQREGLDRWNDYSNVHPFAIALCPPHHIWPRFIFDGDLCEVQDEGSLKRTPLEHCDSAKIAEPQKHYPFLHVMNDTETYRPNKT